jgi:4-alpha-glucanotransferase
LNWLQSLQLLPESWDPAVNHTVFDKRFDIALCGAVLDANARSRSKMVLFQLDDLQLLEEPVNIPGTYREYPNWRRKQKIDTRDLFGDPQIKALLASTYRERKLWTTR